MITLQFSATNSPASRLICWRTWSKVSHVDLVLPNGRLYGATYEGGVGEHSPRSDYSRVYRYTAPLPFDGFHEELRTQEGKPYDLPGALGIGLHRDWSHEGAWWCSELMLWGSVQIAMPLLRAEHVQRVSPEHLLMSPLLKRI